MTLYVCSCNGSRRRSTTSCFIGGRFTSASTISILPRHSADVAFVRVTHGCRIMQRCITFPRISLEPLQPFRSGNDTCRSKYSLCEKKGSMRRYLPIMLPSRFISFSSSAVQFPSASTISTSCPRPLGVAIEPIRFWVGVPVTIHRCSTLSFDAAVAYSVLTWAELWPSSMTSRFQRHWKMGIIPWLSLQTQRGILG